MIEYNKSNIPKAKQLRKNMTKQERKLWYEYLRYYPVRFQRQKSINEYIVDFYCAKAKLAVELDGNQHYETQQAVEYDQHRTEMLESKGIYVLRIYNTDVDRNFEGVGNAIDVVVKRSLTPSQHKAVTPPSSEGGMSKGGYVSPSVTGQSL